MSKGCLFFCSLFILGFSFVTYQLILFIDLLKENPLVQPEKCTLVRGIMGPEDIVNWHGIGLTGSDDRVKLWYGGDKTPIEQVPNGAIYAIYPSNETQISFKQLKLHNFPEEIAFHPHGMALYPHKLYVINHAYSKGGERIEVFDTECCDGSEGQVKLIYNHSLILPQRFGAFNDILTISENEILITEWISPPHSVKGTHNSETIWLDLQRVFNLIFVKKTHVNYCKSNEKHELTCKELEITAHQSNNGIAYDRKDLLIVAKPTEKKVVLYRIVEKNGDKDLVYLRDIVVNFVIDNIDYDPDTNTFYLGVFGRTLDFLIAEYEMWTTGELTSNDAMKSGVVAIKIEENIDNMKPEVLYFQKELNGVSVATKFKDYILMGSPFVDGISVCLP